MATDSKTLVQQIQTNRYPALSERDTLLCLCGFYGVNAGLTASQALAIAQSLKYPALSNRDFWECFLAAIS